MGEDLGNKLKGLWNKVTNEVNVTGRKFGGTGHRLGGSDEGPGPATAPAPRHGAAAPRTSALTGPQRPPSAPAQQPAAARPGSAAAAAAAAEQRLSAAATRHTGARSRGGDARRPASPKPQAVVVPAAEFDPFKPAIGGGASLNAIKDAPQLPPSAAAVASPSSQTVVGAPPPPGSALGVPSSAAAAGGAFQVGSYPEAAAEQSYEIHQWVALIVSQPPDKAAGSVEVLSKLLGNLLSKPQEPKFRQVRLGNRRIREAVADAPGGCELLSACGFVVHREESDPDGGYAAFLEDEKLPLVQEGLLQLQSVAAAAAVPSSGGPSSSSSSTTGGAATAAAPGPGPLPGAPAAGSAVATAAAAAGAALAVDRQLQVILPVASEISLDASFFERTPAEVRAEYARMVKRRREGELLVSRATREAHSSAVRGRPPTKAAVRVRFPEGLQLAAEFSVREPAESVHAAVSSALRRPATLFELVLPDRRPLPRGGTVGEAGIAPSVLLNFRSLEGGAGEAGGRLPLLSDEMLQMARVD